MCKYKTRVLHAGAKIFFLTLVLFILLVQSACIVKLYGEKIVHSGVKAPNLAW